MKKRTRKLLSLAALCFLLVLPVSAAEQGSLLLTNVTKPVTLYAVADANDIPCSDFAGATGQLNEDDLNSATAKKLQQYAAEQNLSGTTCNPSESHKVFFETLEEGWYLVCSQGEKAEFAPFLICVPMPVGEKLVYHMQAEPKTDIPTDSTAPSTPIEPEPNIPQTGAVLWHKYLLFILGAVAICAGLFEVIRGQENRYE